MSRRDFRAAISRIPATTPFRHHGRHPNIGLDCVGFILHVYGDPAVNLNIDALDHAYGERDDARPHRAILLRQRLELTFRVVDAHTPLDCRDGDVLVIGTERRNHLAICLRGVAVEMTGRGIRATRLTGRVWGFVQAVYRHPHVAT